MRSLIVALLMLASPAIADERTFDFLAQYGCTVSEQSKDALENAGFLEPYTNAIIADALARGVARQEGEYVVLDESICTIRLPLIESRWSVDSPEIQTIAPYIRDVFEFDGEVEVTEGCFIRDVTTLFTEHEGGDEEAGYAAYIAFLGASIISGEVGVYATTPWAPPLGVQVTTGGCARAPNVPAIIESHLLLETAFNDWVRAVGAQTPCGEGLTSRNMQIGVEVQDVDFQSIEEETKVYNAWLGVEFQVIAMSAGWFDDMSVAQPGFQRPPLCHYTD